MGGQVNDGTHRNIRMFLMVTLRNSCLMKKSKHKKV